MRQSLLILLLFIFSFKANSQTESNSYKSLSDSTFTVGDKIKLPDIHFSLSGGLRIMHYCYDSLKLIADFIKRYPDYTFEIGVHTDSRGEADFNKMLAERRAKKIKAFLVTKHQIEKIRLKAVGYGESRPVVPENRIHNSKNHDEEEKLRQKNRRYELTILEN